MPILGDSFVNSEHAKKQVAREETGNASSLFVISSRSQNYIWFPYIWLDILVNGVFDTWTSTISEFPTSFGDLKLGSDDGSSVFVYWLVYLSEII